MNIPIPGGTVVNVEKDTSTDGYPIERMTLIVNETHVEIIRYNGDNAGVSVAIGGPLGSLKIMPADKVTKYIEQSTEE